MPAKFIVKIFDYKILIACLIIFRTMLGVVFTYMQYYAWKSPLGLASIPLDTTTVEYKYRVMSESLRLFVRLFGFLFEKEHGYFIFYALERFWINIILSIGIGVAVAFWIFLTALEKYKKDFLETKEKDLGFAVALTVDWPNFIIFVFVVFCAVLILALFRRLIFKKRRITLGWPLMAPGVIIVFWGMRLLEIFNLI